MANEMNQPERRRGNDKQRAVRPGPPGVDLTQVAQRARYVGSVIHKDSPSFVGPVPRPQPSRSVCPRVLNQNQPLVQHWLQAAIAAGHFGRLWISGFPKYVWHRDGHTIYEGQLMSPYGQGHYKGYPLEPDDVVRGLP